MEGREERERREKSTEMGGLDLPPLWEVQSFFIMGSFSRKAKRARTRGKGGLY